MQLRLVTGATQAEVDKSLEAARTRVSFSAGITQLGGSALMLLWRGPLAALGAIVTTIVSLRKRTAPAKEPPLHPPVAILAIF